MRVLEVDDVEPGCAGEQRRPRLGTDRGRGVGELPPNDQPSRLTGPGMVLMIRSA